MQFKLIASLACASLVAANGGGGGSGSQCTTGPIQCCDSVQSAGSPAAAKLLALLGVVVQDVNVPIGITCTSILGGGSCSAQTVCCENDNFNGVIAIGCSPITI